MARPTWHFSLLLLSFALACTGDIGAGGDELDGPRIEDRREPGEPPPPVDDEVVIDAECADRSGDVALAPLRRLSAAEMVASLRALFPAGALEENAVWISGLPQDITRHSPGEFTPGTTQELVDAALEIAVRVAGTVARNDDYLRAVAPACLLGAADVACASEFVESFGPRVLRRPLSADDTALYVEAFESDEGVVDPRDRVEVLLATMLTSPEFTHQVPQLQNDGERAPLDPFALAARISLAVTGAGPDQALLDAAAAGELDDVATREAQARRLLMSEGGRAHVRALFVRWLGMHGQASPQEAADAAGVNVDGLYDEMREEALDFVEHVVFEESGAFDDLMTSKLVFPKTDRLAALFGTERSDGPVETSGRRAGLLTRPALLISDNPRSSPILRGLHIWDRFFCHTFTLPEGVDVDDIAMENLAALPDPNRATARERTEVATGSPQCASCHDSINPPGFSLAHFGALGEEWGDDELVHVGDETLEIPLEGDANVDLVIDGSTQTLDGAGEMAGLIAGSQDGLLCAARQVFRSTHLRDAVESDACHLQDLYLAMESGAPILDILVMNAALETPVIFTGE